MEMKPKDMSIDQVRKLIKKKEPSIIFLAGKTCTGKSTFGRSLEPLGYKQIEFDLIVRKEVRDKFLIKNSNEAFEVYKNNAPIEWQESFEKAARDLILKSIKNSKIVIDAAIGDVEVIKRIFKGELSNFMGVFFHPYDLNFYHQSILNRLMNDFKNHIQTFPIWEDISNDVFLDLTNFGDSGRLVNKLIDNYAKESTIKSEYRYMSFKKVYSNFILTGH